MVRVEFNSPLISNDGFMRKFCFVKHVDTINEHHTSIMFKSGASIFVATNFMTAYNYIPTADPYLDRSFILEQLGISKEQDELNQKEYENSKDQDS